MRKVGARINSGGVLLTGDSHSRRRLCTRLNREYLDTSITAVQQGSLIVSSYRRDRKMSLSKYRVVMFGAIIK